jgi:uncharacterized membrane protein YkvA (DUF1232 family)
MDWANLLWKLVLAALAAGMLYVAFLVARLAFRFWKVGLVARTVAALAAGTGYVASPVDAMPDLLLGIGWLDDLVVIALTLLYLRSLWLQSRRAPAGSSASRATVNVVPEILPR